jgi:hypothetical protein
MKNMTYAAIAAAFLVAPALAGAQQPSPSPSPSPAPTQAPAPAGAEMRADRADKANKGETARGELVKIDSEAKKLTIKGADGTETSFAYTDATEVGGGGRDGVAGLATKSGSKVVVHYTTEAGTKTATKIEVQGGASSSRP